MPGHTVIIKSDTIIWRLLVQEFMWWLSRLPLIHRAGFRIMWDPVNEEFGFFAKPKEVRDDPMVRHDVWCWQVMKKVRNMISNPINNVNISLLYIIFIYSSRIYKAKRAAANLAFARAWLEANSVRGILEEDAIAQVAMHLEFELLRLQSQLSIRIHDNMKCLHVFWIFSGMTLTLTPLHFQRRRKKSAQRLMAWSTQTGAST